MRRAVAVVLLAAALPLHAAGKAKIRALNVSAQAVMAVVRGVVQRRSIAAPDVAKMFVSGAAAGYGFYQAKRLVANDHITAGWLVANAAASVTENAAAGKHPLAEAGYSVGPLRFRVAIPHFEPSADSYVFVDLYTYEAGAFLRGHHENDSTHFSSGLISFHRDTYYAHPAPTLYQVGDTFGMYPGVWRGWRPSTRAAVVDAWHHEVIHAVQSLQVDSIEPRLPHLSFTPPPRARRRVIRFDALQLGLVNLTNDRITRAQNYEDRWNELEAYRLAQNTAPVPLP